MNQSLQALTGSMLRALRDEIFPELSSDHARSQLAGVLDVLSKLQTMVVWSPDVVREQIGVLETGIAAALTQIRQAGMTGPELVPRPDSNGLLSQADLAASEARFARMTDWLFAPPAPLPAALSVALHESFAATLRNTLKAQRRLVPEADFSSMTAPGK